MITKSGHTLASGGKAVDVYSFACVLYELVAGKIPWSNAPSAEHIFQKVENGLRPTLISPSAASGDQISDADCQEKLQSLICLCWKQNPAERPTFTQIIKSLDKINGDTMDSTELSNRKPQKSFDDWIQPSTLQETLSTPLLLETMKDM